MKIDKDFLFKDNIELEQENTTETVRREIEAIENALGEKSQGLIDKFVDHYEKRNNHNRGMRIAFFAISFLIILAIIGTFSTVSILIAIKESINVEGVVAICSACATILTSVLVLPHLVGKNLFPEKEDEQILTFVKEMNQTELQFAKVKLEEKNTFEKKKTERDVHKLS